MRKHKLILSNVLTVLLVLLTSFSVLSQPLVSAVDTTNFDVYVYMADNMLTSNTVAGKSLKYYTNEYMTLAEIMRDSMTDEFRNSVIAWEDINLALSPSDIAEKPIEAYGYYTTVLLSMLKCTYENEPTSAAIGFAKNSKSVSSLYGDFAKFYKLNAKADLDEILELPNLSKSQKDELTRLQKEWLEGKGWLKTSEACGNIMKVVGAIDDVNKGVERFVQYSMLCQVNSEWQESLQYMYTHCDKSNEPLKQALNTIIESSKSYELGIAYSIKDAVVDADAAVAGIIIDGLVDIIVEEFPIIKGMQIGQSVGKTISNMLFATDKTIEKFYIVNAYCEILDLFKASYNNAKNTYLNSKTSENAQKFITYTDMYFTTLDIGGDFGMDFLKTIYSGGILNSLFGSAEEYNQIIKSQENCLKMAQEAHDTITTSWIIDLYTDNPEMYEVYATVLKKNKNFYVEPTRIEFESESVEWGLDDSILYGYNCTVYPANANCKELIYTCSDPSILEFLPNGRINLHKTGECVITATSVEYSDIYDTLNVKVVEGSGANGESIALLTPYQPTVPDASDFEYTFSDGVTVTKYKGKYPNVIIPDTFEGYPVTTIGSSAFSGNKALASVVIPDSVTEINTSAFYSCTSLSSITLSNNLKKIDYWAFQHCDSLTSIEIPSSLTSAVQNGSGIFAYCNNLKNISFAPGTTTVVPGLFASCPGIESISIPNGVKTIGYNSFYGCSNLKTINISDSVIEIENNAFSECTNLSKIIIPDSVKTLGNDVFYNCDRLYSVVLPSNILEISNSLFGDCDNLETITIPNKVTKIGGSAFYGCDKLSEIVIPNSVTSIGSSAFSNCTKLSKVTLSNSLQSIGQQAFYNCDSLTSIEIPKSLTSVYSSSTYTTFQACDNLTNVTFEEGTTSIVPYLFANCDSLTSITIPNSVKTIGNYAFYGCDYLDTVTISNGVTSIGNNAFSGCTYLSDVYIPSTVTTIGNYAFNNCKYLTIHGFSGSFAETYASNNSISFTAMSGVLISTNPQSASVIEGQNATFSLSASGSNLTYQWQEYDGSGWATLIGETRATLTIKNADSCRNGYKYRCIVSDGNSSVTSEEAILTVTSSSSVTLDQVKAMSIEELIAFVNGIPNNDNIILTEAQLYAIQKVLQYDLGRTA